MTIRPPQLLVSLHRRKEVLAWLRKVDTEVDEMDFDAFKSLDRTERDEQYRKWVLTHTEELKSFFDEEQWNMIRQTYLRWTTYFFDFQKLIIEPEFRKLLGMNHGQLDKFVPQVYQLKGVPVQESHELYIKMVGEVKEALGAACPADLSASR